ncbi:MAG: hypothetical protein ACHRXM_12615 [Isosphaerales bacterium]
MEPLDLSVHEVEEFHGKGLTWKGVNWIVGRHIATGAEAIVHRLVHGETGECNFVLKVLRNPDALGSFDQPSDGEFHSPHPIMLMQARLAVPGGIVLIQPLTQSSDNSPKMQLMSEAQARIEAGDLPGALRIYEDIYVRYRNDPQVVYNFGATQTLVRDYDRAFTLFREALALDPYDVTFRKAVLQTAMAAGQFQYGQHIWDETKSLFFRSTALNAPAVTLLSELGLPELALEALATATDLPAEERSRLLPRLEQDVLAKRAAAAVLDRARRELPEDARHQPLAAEVLSKALELYPRDHVTAINLGFSHRCAGQHAQAASALISRYRYVPANLARAALVNAGLCQVLAGDCLAALQLLDFAFGWYCGPSGEEPDHWDVNGLVSQVMTFEGGLCAFIEEGPEKTLLVLAQLRSQVAPAALPGNVLRYQSCLLAQQGDRQKSQATASGG